MTRLSLSFWAGLIFILTALSARSSTDPEWFTRVWQTDDGLLDNDVNGIVQGPADYLWLVTPVGLMRFDGINFTPFGIEDLNGPNVSRVRMLLCSRTGILWVASDSGDIIALHPNFSMISLKHDVLPGHPPIALASDNNGALWLGYPNVIGRVQNGQITAFTEKEGVPPGTFHALSSDGIGNVWLAKGDQISIFRNGKFFPIISVEGVECMTATPTNAVWLVAKAHLFYCDIDGKTQDCGAFREDANVKTAAMLEDQDGAVWIATDGNGLFRYDQARIDRMQTSHSSVLSLAEDQEGNIWAGTGGGGLDRISRCGIRLEVPENKQIQSQIQSICQDGSGRFWGASQNGALVSSSGGGWEPVMTNAPFAGMVTCVTADGSAVWAGTRDGKLLRIINTNYTTWTTNLAGPVHGLLAASNKDLWIVGTSTVQRLHKGRLQNIRLPRQVQGIYAIAEDAAGNIWFGANAGLLRFNGTKLVDENSHLPITGRPICCLYGTKDGSLWIGSRRGGLMRLKNGHAGEIGLSQGLVNDYLSQIVADEHGWLWFASKRGIFKIRQTEIERAMRDPDILLRPIVYGKNEGLISQEAVFSIATPFVFPQAIRSRDGRVWMLTHTGIVVADPNILPESTTPPPVLLTQVTMDGQILISHDSATPTESVAGPEGSQGPLKIPPSHRHLKFDFTAFHFSAPENLRFRYKLIGYDNAWIDAGTQRSADYSRLPPGKYQFGVEASVGDGSWVAPATLNFDIVPFFWQTWWFRSGVLLVFTLSVIAIVRYVSYRRLRFRLHTMEQQAVVERERGRIARDIHDDLGNRLTEIQLLTGLAQRNHETPEKSIVHIHEISSAARQATDALDEIVWAINPRNDTLPHLINYLGQYAADYLRTAGIQCRVDLPENPPAQSVSAEVRHNLFLVIKETLNNIARHSNATEVSVVILATDKSLSVIVEDNGRGFNSEMKNNGADGLDNMRQRISEIGGQLQIKSKPGAGTCISFNGLWLAEK